MASVTFDIEAIAKSKGQNSRSEFKQNPDGPNAFNFQMSQ